MSRTPTTCEHGVCPKSACRQCSTERHKKWRNTPKGRAAYNAAANRHYHRNRDQWWIDKPVQMRFQSMIANIRRRKRCDFSVSDLLQLWEKQHSCCAYCNTEMTYERGGRKSTSVSVDRIDPAKHYTLDNIVLACWGCNSGKGIMTTEEYIAHCKKVAYQHPDD